MKRFCSLFRYDIKTGMILRWRQYLVLFCVVVILVAATGGSTGEDGLALGGVLSECLMDVFGGSSPYVYNPQEPIKLPYAWLIVTALMLYMVAGYAKEESGSYGAKLLVMSGTRNLWWFSKCLWLAVSLGGFYFVCGIAIAVSVGFFDVVGINPIANDSFQGSSGEAGLDSDQDGLALILSIAVGYFALLSIGIIQMILSLKFNTVAAYVAALVVVVLAVFVNNPFLVSTYMMVLRSELFLCGGFAVVPSLLLLLSLACVLSIVGARLFRHMDFCQ